MIYRRVGYSDIQESWLDDIRGELVIVIYRRVGYSDIQESWL